MQREFDKKENNMHNSSIYSIDEATIFDPRIKEINDVFEGNNISEMQGSLGQNLDLPQSRMDSR